VPIALGRLGDAVDCNLGGAQPGLCSRSLASWTPLADLGRAGERPPAGEGARNGGYLTSVPRAPPTALMHTGLKHYKVLHERTPTHHRIRGRRSAFDRSERVRGWSRSARPSPRDAEIRLMESPPKRAKASPSRENRLAVDIMSAAFFLSRRSLKRPANPHAARPGPHVIALSRTANAATDYFRSPAARVVEVGNARDHV